MPERHPAPVIGAGRDQDREPIPSRLAVPRLRPGPAPGRLPLTVQDVEVLHRDHGAVEEPLLPTGGADAKPVADRDLQRRRRPVVLRPPAHRHRDAIDFLAIPFSVAGEAARPHQVRQRPHLGVGARQHDGALSGCCLV